jgi:enoyl-CoA hydratase/carnithine racemase
MIELQVTGAVAEVVLENPRKLNTLDEVAFTRLDQALTAAAQEGVRALVLRGEGRAFCAGRDISRVDPAQDDAAAFLDGAVRPVLRRLADFPAPTYGVGHGACLGVGLGLLVACDVVYVADDAQIGSPFVNLGAVLDSGGHQLFYERLGSHRAMDLAYSGELMTGAQAVAAGLFARSMPATELMDFTRAMAARVAAGPTAAHLASKRVMGRLRAQPTGLWDSMSLEAQAQAEASKTGDYQEGFAAFKGKRRPEFHGA